MDNKYFKDYQIDYQRVHTEDLGVMDREVARLFSLQELSKYNGINGMPAYIAVNGFVYDVTDNAAWAAATHFGLSAGNDVSAAFSRCHFSESALLKLRVVGRLVEE